MQTFEQFAADSGVTLTAIPANDHTMNVRRVEHFRWTCTLQKGGKSETFEYSMGPGHVEKKRGKTWISARLPGFCHGWGKYTMQDASDFVRDYRPAKPKLPDVLQSLALDSSTLNAGCFEDWADEYGYEQDSREAEKIYKACLENARKLRGLLGYSAFNELLNCEEE